MDKIISEPCIKSIFNDLTQIELLRDILVQLPYVKVNWEIRKDIEKAFKDYDKQAF